ncbi:MAG TPA: hypothetical protein VFT66_18560 [Roseiflexaceae bacterium]|jgi:hypothetical protein|nr:hypothetical protein [Roseiflexaceae bacterium]
MTERQSASQKAYDRQLVLQERISAYQQEIENRRAKIGRIQHEVAMLEGRGDNADHQRDSIATVQEEIRVLEQQLTTLERQAEDPIDPTQSVATPEFVPGGMALVASDGGLSNKIFVEPRLDDVGIFAQSTAGTQFTLLDGPEQADGHTWWRVRRTDGVEGWVVTDGLMGNPA